MKQIKSYAFFFTNYSHYFLNVGEHQFPVLLLLRNYYYLGIQEEDFKNIPPIFVKNGGVNKAI